MPFDFRIAFGLPLEFGGALTLSQGPVLWAWGGAGLPVTLSGPMIAGNSKLDTGPFVPEIGSSSDGGVWGAAPSTRDKLTESGLVLNALSAILCSGLLLIRTVVGGPGVIVRGLG